MSLIFKRDFRTGAVTTGRARRERLMLNVEIGNAPAPATNTYFWADAALAVGAALESGVNSPAQTADPRYINFAPTNGSSATLSSVNGGIGGTAQLDITYAYDGGTGDRTGELVINGVAQSITFTSTEGFGIWLTKRITVTLNAGTTNTIVLRSTGADLANVHSLAVFPKLIADPPAPTPPPAPGPAPTPPPPPAPGQPQLLQAEDGTLSGGVAIEDTNGQPTPHFTGTGYANFPATGGKVEWTSVHGGSGGSARLDIRYAYDGNSGDRVAVLRINGVAQPITFVTTGDWDNYVDQLQVYVILTAGATNTISIESNGADCGNVDSIYVVPNTVPPPVVTNDPFALQAEDMALSGGAVLEAENGSGFTGNGYVNFLELSGSKAELSAVNGGVSGGSARIDVTYAYDGNTGTRTGVLRVNGVAYALVTPSTGTWNTYVTLSVYVTMTAGFTNTISIETTGQDLANIDKITVNPNVAAPPVPAPPPPAPPPPSPAPPAPAPSPVGAIDPADIHSIANPNNANNTAVGGWSVEWDGRNTSLAAVTNTVGSGVTANNNFATGPLGPIRFGKVNAPDDATRRAWVFRGHPNDAYTAGAPRSEMLCWQTQPGKLPVKTIFWQAFGVYLTAQGFPATSDFCLAQWHTYGMGVHGYAGQPFFGIYLRNGTYSLQHRYNGNSTLSAGTTTAIGTGGITAGGAPVGRWDYWIMQACISPFVNDNPFLKVWRSTDGVNLTQVHNKSQPLGYSGFDTDDRPFPKLGHYPYLSGNPWAPVATRELYLRCPVFVNDPLNEYSAVDLLNYVKTR